MEIKYELVKRITKREGAATDIHYKEAHEYADKLEKAKYSDGYERLRKLETVLTKDWFGDNFPDGRIIVSKVVPEALREEVAFHEHTENLKLKELHKKDRESKFKAKHNL